MCMNFMSNKIRKNIRIKTNFSSKKAINSLHKTKVKMTIEGRTNSLQKNEVN